MLREEAIIDLVELMLENQEHLSPGLVTELRRYQAGFGGSRSHATYENFTSREPDWNADPRQYIRLAAAIRSDIENGRLKPGDQVPAHSELARRHGVSIPTAGKAVRLLAALGITERDGNAYWVCN